MYQDESLVVARQWKSKTDNGGRNRATAKDFPFASALPVAPVHDMVTRRLEFPSSSGRAAYTRW